MIQASTPPPICHSVISAPVTLELGRGQPRPVSDSVGAGSFSCRAGHEADLEIDGNSLAAQYAAAKRDSSTPDPKEGYTTLLVPPAQ